MSVEIDVDESDDNAFLAFLRCFVEPMQEVEDVFNALRVLKNVDDSTGAQLDLIGRFVRYGRNGLDDDAYRPRLKARLLVINSDTTIEVVIAIAKLVIGDGAYTLQVRNEGNDTFVIQVRGMAISNDTANVLVDMLNHGKAGAVRAIVESSDQDPASWMRWDVDTWDTKVMVVARDEQRE